MAGQTAAKQATGRDVGATGAKVRKIRRPAGARLWRGRIRPTAPAWPKLAETLRLQRRRRQAFGWALWLYAATQLGQAAQAARHYDPFDEEKLLLPADADALAVEDTAALREEAGEETPKPVHLAPMVMLQVNGALGQGVTTNGMVQVETTLRHGPLGVAFTPRLRFSDFAHPMARSSALLQQAYLFLRAGGGEIKAGKVYAQFGRAWDFGLYGPLIAAADTKLTPEAGVSFELSQSVHPRFTVEVAGQYFPVDGRTFSVRNPSLFSTARARRRNVAGVRVVPVVHLGETRLNLGLSGQHYTATRPEPHPIWRTAADLGADHPRFAAFVEVGRQAGQDVQPSDDAPLSSFNYLWTGIEAKLSPVSVRFHFNVVRYEAPHPGVDVLFQPGGEWTVNDAVSVALEGAFWRTNQQELPRGERSLFTTIFFKL